MSRLAAEIWVAAYRARLEAQGIACFVVAKGEAMSGAILVKCATMDGQAQVFQRVMTMEGDRPWDVLAEGHEAEVDATIRRAREFDRDLWVIEVEDRQGRHMLDEEGLT